MERLDVRLISYTASHSPQDELKSLRQKFNELFIQSFDPAFIKSINQVRTTLYQTLYARRTCQSLARDMGVELLMRIAGEDQIERAVSVAGAKRGSKAYLVIAGDKDKVEDALPLLMKGLKDAKNAYDLPDKSDDDDYAISRAAMVGVDRFKPRAKAQTP
ncbi:MAG: KEOPS complex subunit Cgi121 [Conexivisphaerales archaeon]